MKIVRLSVLLLVCLCAATSALATDVFLPRFPAVSPDGQTVVFSFQGDLWSVPVSGGQAVRLTAHEAYDAHAVFSPDGSQIAFASDRYGDDDIYIMPATGGAPTRLTFASTPDVPGAFSPDGQTIYFASRRLFDFPMGSQIHSIPVSGGTPERLVDVFGDEVATADGQTFIIAEGRVKTHRVRYRGTYQREIYSWTAGSDPVRLTTNRGYDMNPMVDDAGMIYWIGDQNEDKRGQVYRMGPDGSSPQQLTTFRDDPVRSASLSRDGKTLVVEMGYQLVVVNTDTGRAIPMSIQVAADQIENPVVLKNFTADADELSVSSDGEEFAMTIEGEIVLVNKDLGGRATVIDLGAHRERHISFRPGGADTLVLVTDKDGEDAVCLLVSDDENESNLRKARTHKLVPLTDGTRPATGPLWSPDGKKILYTAGNADLHIMNHDGGDDFELFPHWGLAGYSWSPDNNWVAISRYDRNFNSDILIIPAEGGEAVNVSRHPDTDDNPVWAADGSMLAWDTSRHSLSPSNGQTEVFFVYLQKELHERSKDDWKIWEKTRDDKPEKPAKEDEVTEDADESDVDVVSTDDEEKFVIDIDFEDIYLRAKRLTSSPEAESVRAIDPKGDRIYFTRRVDGKTDLFSLDRFGEEEKQVTKGGTGPGAVELDAKGKTFTFLKKGQPSWVAAKGGDVESVDFTARMSIDNPAVRLQVLDEGWRQMRDNFYDADMHGLNWPKLRAKYGDWAQKVSHDRDFASVVNFMLGELNASHMGYYANFGRFGDYGPDGFLGLEWDATEAGLVVTSVLKNGPCDKVKSKVEVGDRLVSIGGVPVTTGQNLYVGLENRADVPTWLMVERDGDELEFEVTPITWRPLWNLNYRRMEAAKRTYTEEKTDSRVGYVHIQGMGWSEVERFEQNLFAAADGKDALVIDVRNNGGGWTTDLLLTILTQPVHAYTIPRDGEIGYPKTERAPFFGWSKPIAVICNEGSYSNAEIFSHAIKTIGRGPVVGVETGGNVISTGGFGNRYKGYIRMPFRGWYVWGDQANPERNHKNQEGAHELTGFLPDYEVPLTVSDRLHKRDPQLDKAIELMLEAADEAAAGPQRTDHPGYGE